MIKLLSQSFGLLVTPATSGITVPVKDLILILYPKRKKHIFVKMLHSQGNSLYMIFFADSKKIDMIRDQKIEFSPLSRGWGSGEWF